MKFGAHADILKAAAILVIIAGSREVEVRDLSFRCGGLFQKPIVRDACGLGMKCIVFVVVSCLVMWIDFGLHCVFRAGP